MLLKRLAVLSMPLYFAGAALAGASVGSQGAEETADLGRAFSSLHAVAQAAINISDMAEKNAKSQLVKDYAKQVSSGNAALDTRLMEIASQLSIEITPLEAQTDAVKSLVVRLEAEKELLSSLDGDAWDKEYMTLVTNTQQSVLKFSTSRIATATNERVRTFFTNLKALVEGRLTIAQEILEKVYGNDL